MVAGLIFDKQLAVTTNYGEENALEAMRSTDFLDEYERGDLLSSSLSQKLFERTHSILMSS